LIPVWRILTILREFPGVVLCGRHYNRRWILSMDSEALGDIGSGAVPDDERYWD